MSVAVPRRQARLAREGALVNTTVLDRSSWLAVRVGRNRAHKPEAQARGVRKCISLNALRLRFRLVASDFPGIVIVCILDGDRSGAVELSSSGFTAANWAAHCKSSFVRQALLLVRSARVTRCVRLFICPSPGESRRSERRSGQTPLLHWPPAVGHSAQTVGHRRPRLTPRLPLGTLALLSRPSAPDYRLDTPRGSRITP